MNLEIENIKKLIKVLSDNNLSEITIEDKDEITENKQAISIKRSCVAGVKQPTVACKNQCSEVDETIECEETTNSECGKPVVSPVTGTFYASSTPGGSPYVKLGEIVSEGQILCVVEAMKLMNEIEAESSGKIIKICAQDGEMVESGQVLMYIE